MIFFSIIHEAHLSTGHGGRNRIQNEVQIKDKNVTAEYIVIYLRLCVSCLKKGQVPQKGLVARPMVFSEMNSRGQVDLIDMQSQADVDYKWILVYQDHLTKFVNIRPTKTKRATEIAYILLDIFVLLALLVCYKVVTVESSRIRLLMNCRRCGMV